jgi:hypothetical protein
MAGWNNTNQPKHVASVGRLLTGMWQGTCSCGWLGAVWKEHRLAVEGKDQHLKEAMRPDPMAKWSSWMQGMTVEEPGWPEKA